MSVGLLCLILFASLGLLLLAGIELWRSALVVRGKRTLSEFPGGTPHGSDAYWRLNRAHLNLLETLPIFAVLILSAEALGFKSASFDQLCFVMLGARCVQIASHLASGANAAISVRSFALLVQLAAMTAMAGKLLLFLAD